MTCPDTRVLTLPGLRLPADGPLLRQHVRDEAERDEDYRQRYDRTTLLYDAVRLANGRVLMTAPRLLNLWPALRDGIRIDGLRPRLRRRVFGKFEFISTRAPGDTLTFQTDSLNLTLPIRPAERAAFAGQRCVVTMNRDNDLHWIRDWAQHYASRHGLEGVLIYDNGSTAYTPQALADILAGVPGLRTIRIVVVDFPYGTVSSGEGAQIRPKFLQPAMMNLARADFLAGARAVLNIDIDEIIPAGPQTVFDATLATRLGVLRIPGRWIYPAPDAPMPCRHADHLYTPEQRIKCNYKWCARPGGLLDAIHGWNVHRIGGQAFKMLPPAETFRFFHCRGVSTGWKSEDRRYALPENLRHTPELAQILPEATQP
ncbi:MAG: hypothetical protein ACK5IB_06995 [Qingshengfaniella sp.]